MEYQSILYKAAQEYPKRLFNHFFKGKIRENCWHQVLSLKNDSFTFGTESKDCQFSIVYHGLNIFSITVPLELNNLENEIQEDFQCFMKKLGFHLFITKKFNHETIFNEAIPLTDETNFIFTLLKLFQYDFLEFERNMKLQLNAFLFRKFSFHFNPFEPKPSLSLLFDERVIRTFEKEEEVHLFIDTLLEIRDFKNKIEKFITDYLLTNNVPYERNYRGFFIYGETYFPKTDFFFDEYNQICFSFEFNNKVFFFTDLNEMEKILSPEFIKIMKKLRLKSIFNEKKEALY